MIIVIIIIEADGNHFSHRDSSPIRQTSSSSSGSRKQHYYLNWNRNQNLNKIILPLTAVHIYVNDVVVCVLCPVISSAPTSP